MASQQGSWEKLRITPNWKLNKELIPLINCSKLEGIFLPWVPWVWKMGDLP